MKTLTLAKPWSYVTPQVTIDYGAGTHEVTDLIHTAAVKAGATEEEAANGTSGQTGAVGKGKG